MLRLARPLLHSKPAASAKGSLRSLRRQLAGLKAANAAAAAQLSERRRLAALLQRHRWEMQQRDHSARSRGESSDAGGEGTKASTSTSASAAAEAERALRAAALKLLPRNEELETAIAFTLRENRDARTELEFTRHLLGSTLLSLASPVGPWDPYDVKPQVFALDNYLALPVFTSVEYLQLFCHRFGFVARDPSGVLWADGRDFAQTEEEHGRRLLLPPDNVTSSMWWGKQSHTPSARGEEEAKGRETRGEQRQAADGGGGGDARVENVGHRADGAAAAATVPLDATDLFDDLADATPSPIAPLSASSTLSQSSAQGAADESGEGRGISHAVSASAPPPPPRHKAKTARRPAKRRLKKKRLRQQRCAEQQAADPRSKEDQERAAATDKAAKEAFWHSVAQVTPFQLKQATPLPTFGPFVYPFFIGYFADVNTLLHNAAIVPNKVDVVLNPTSPTEFVLAREATDRILHHDQLLLLAYQRVEKELQREFSAFFARHCPEVAEAKTACVPRPLHRNAAERALKASREFSDGDNPLQDQRARTQLLRESTYTGGVGYDIALLVRSTDLATTYACMQWGKEKCLLMGHPDLDVLPEDAAASHVAEAAEIFYRAANNEKGARQANSPSALFSEADAAVDGSHTRATAGEPPGGSTKGEHHADTDTLLGGFRKMGASQTISVSQPADSYFHDPTNAYTESHAVFTEELKIRGNQW